MPAGRPLEPAGDGRPRWMAATGAPATVRRDRIRRTGRLVRRSPASLTVHHGPGLPTARRARIRAQPRPISPRRGVPSPHPYDWIIASSSAITTTPRTAWYHCQLCRPASWANGINHGCDRSRRAAGTNSRKRRRRLLPRRAHASRHAPPTVRPADTAGKVWHQVGHAGASTVYFDHSYAHPPRGPVRFGGGWPSPRR
jgi:hypothetical protein